jgi:TFIIF-interacting CTD phosphatase-like protein
VVTLIEEDPAPASKDIIDRNNRLKFFVVFIFLNTCVILFVCA